jgi:hypothetical protein
MRFLISVLLVMLPLGGLAAKVKVPVPDLEHSCEALLDTKKMPRRDYDRIAALERFLSFPSTDPIGFLDAPGKIKKAKAEVEKNFSFVKRSVKNVRAFRQLRWKKLGQHLILEARAAREKELAAIAFMETWDPAPLLDPDDTRELAHAVPVTWREGMEPDKLPQYSEEAKQRLLSLPLEERDLYFLTCNQRLQALADESRFEKFSEHLARYQCADNGDPEECKERFRIRPEMKKSEREGRRIYGFQWAWYNNGVCPFVNGKVEVPEYEGPAVEELLKSALTDEQCDYDDGCDD